MKATPEWILASGSPRRKELLRHLRDRFQIHSPDVEEWDPPEADPEEMVTENARRKAQSVADRFPAALVIAADTTVARGRRIFAKPADLADAERMLRALSGRPHHVITGCALVFRGNLHLFTERSRVVFRELEQATLDQYLARVHVLDKAGAYAIQEHGDLIIDHYEGSFENIMGLPIQRLRSELVQQYGFPLPVIPD